MRLDANEVRTLRDVLKICASRYGADVDSMIRCENGSDGSTRVLVYRHERTLVLHSMEDV